MDIDERERGVIRARLLSLSSRRRELERMMDLSEEMEMDAIIRGVELGLRQSEIAQLLGITQGRVSQKLKGKR